MMKKILFCACLALGVSACEKDPDFEKLDSDLVVYTDYASEADFSSYKTYFLPDSILEAGGMHATYWKDDHAKKLIKEVENQMKSRGYERILDPAQKDEADLGVQLTYIAQTNQVVSGGYWNGWWSAGYWGPWWGDWYYPYAVTYTYDTNALIMEMADLTKKGEDGKADSKIPVIWYASAQGFRFASGRVNMQLLLNGIDQAFAQSAYISSNK